MRFRRYSRSLRTASESASWLTLELEEALEARSSGPGDADHRHATVSHRAGRLRFQHAAAARGCIALDDRAHGTWHRANVEPALFRAVQSRRQFSRAMRRSHRRIVQSAAREFRLLSRAGGPGKSCDPGRRAPRRHSATTATGHFATGGSEANYTALLCALTGSPREFLVRRRARLCGAGAASIHPATAISPG